MEPRIDCGRGVLRRPTLDDVDRLTEICQDPEIQRFTRVPIPYTTEDAVRFVERADRMWGAGHPGWLVLEVDGEIVASVGLVAVDHEDAWGELGYWTAPEHRRAGLTTAAVRGLCQWAFDEHGLKRLQLETAAGNDGSQRLARRVGFREEGVRRSAAVLRATGGRPELRVDMTMWGRLPGELLAP